MLVLGMELLEIKLVLFDICIGWLISYFEFFNRVCWLMV